MGLRRSPREVGGKAAQLGALHDAGLPVPPWICVTPAAFRCAGQLEAQEAEALLSLFDATFPSGVRVAVRSSAIGEDSARDSFAGQLDTFLNVDRARLLERVAACHASAFGARASAYRQRRGLATSEIRAAVVVQLMVDARASGVMFTHSPTSGDPGVAMIAAGLGLGEGVVADRVETDSFEVELRQGLVRTRAIAPKRERIASDPAGGTRIESVPQSERERPALTDDEISALCDLGRRVETLLGERQDVEWAFDMAGKLWILQARPITTQTEGREAIWDSSNIVESYPGLSLPLTFSFARTAYERTFRESSRTLGVPEDIVLANWAVHENLVGLIDGRMYYNILNWYRLITLVPGFEGVLPAWEQALGVPRRSVPPAPAASSTAHGKMRVMIRLLHHFFRHDEKVARFAADFQEVQVDFRRLDLSSMEAHALVELYDSLAKKLLGPYAISVVNDLFAQQLYAAVGKLSRRWALGDDAAGNALLAGEAGMESVEPVRSLLVIADMIRADATLRAVLESEAEAPSVWTKLHEHAEAANLCAALHRHLDLYKDRTLHELKLDTPSLQDDPTFLVTMLRNYLRSGRDAATLGGPEQAIRRSAEAEVADRLEGHPLRRLAFRYVLDRCRTCVRHREDLRLLRSRAFGMVKRIFRRLGLLFATEGLIADAGDVFYLTVEEVIATVRGTSVTEDLRSLVALRKREYELFASRCPGARVVTRGITAARGRDAAPTASASAGSEIQGIGCSAGRVSGSAKIVLGPTADLRISGEILVAPMTDPGWVFLMVAAAGIVSERGSVLSHTAIIGRELGIPTIVNARGATTLIRDGQRVEMDGRSGVVRLLDPGIDLPVSNATRGVRPEST